MQPNKFDNAENLTNFIARLADPSTSWEKEKVDISTIDRLINYHMPLILKQTENPKTAPALRESMIALSKRMENEEKFKNPEGHSLAFEVTSIAMGIFSTGERPQWENLPSEALQMILGKLPESLPTSLIDPKYVSKQWNIDAKETEKNFVDQGIISPKTAYGCQNGKEAVQCIIDKGLISANLEDFPDITDDDLTKLINERPNLDHLIVKSQNTKDFPLEKLTHLKTLSLKNSSISGIKLLEKLDNLPKLTVLNLYNTLLLDPEKLKVVDLEKTFKSLSKLTYLNLFNCVQFPQDKVGKALINLTELTALNLGGLKEIPEDNLVKVIKNLKELKLLHVDFNKKIGKDFLEALKMQSKLADLSISFCFSLPGNELVEALKSFPLLTHLNLTGCQVPLDRLGEVLEKCSHLETVNVSFCPGLEREMIGEWQEKYPKIFFMG